MFVFALREPCNSLGANNLFFLIPLLEKEFRLSRSTPTFILEISTLHNIYLLNLLKFYYYYKFQ